MNHKQQFWGDLNYKPSSSLIWKRCVFVILLQTEGRFSASVHSWKMLLILLTCM